MAEIRKHPAMAAWRLVHGVFVFHGDGGEFGGELFDRWETALERSACTSYIGGTGGRFVLSGVVRAKGRRVFLERGIPFATVTDDRFVRGFVTAGSWFGMRIAAFSWADAGRAAEWLKLRDARAEAVVDTLHQLRRSVEAQLRARALAGAPGGPGPTAYEGAKRLAGGNVRSPG